MRIRTEMLSKDSLIILVDALRPWPIKDSVVMACYRADTGADIKRIQGQLEKIKEELENEKLAAKTFLVIMKKRNRLTKLVNKKVALFETLRIL